MEYILFASVIILILLIASRPITKKEQPWKKAKNHKMAYEDYDNTETIVEGLYGVTRRWVRANGYSIFKYVDIKPDANEYTWNEEEGYHKRNDNERTYNPKKEIDDYGVHNNLFVIPLVYILKHSIFLIHIVDGGGVLRYKDNNLRLMTKNGEHLAYAQDFSADGNLDLTMFKNYAKTLKFDEDKIVEVFYAPNGMITDLSQIKNDYNCKVIVANTAKQLTDEMLKVDSQYQTMISKDQATAMVNNFSDRHALSVYQGPVVYGPVYTEIENGHVRLKKSITNSKDEMKIRIVSKEVRKHVSSKAEIEKIDTFYGKGWSVLGTPEEVSIIKQKFKD